MALSSPSALVDQGSSPPRSRAVWIQRLVLLLVLPLVCVGGYYFGTLATPALAPAKSSRDGPVVNGLHIDARSLDLGEIWETPEHVVRVTVKNVGAESRTILRFEQSCDCLGVEPQGMTIQPGQSTEVALRLDLTHRQPYQLGLARWPVSVRLNPVFQGDFAPTPSWEVKVLVRSRVSLETWQLAFGDRCTHTGPPVVRKVRAKAHQPLRRLDAVAVPDIATVRVEPITDADGEYFIVVSPRPDLPVGPFRCQLQIAAVTEDGVVHRCAALGVTGDMRPATRLVPGVILLGERVLGELAQGEVTVFLPQDSWTFDRVEVESTDTNVKRIGIGPDGGVQFRVSQRVAKLGDKVTRVRFILRKSDGTTEPLSLEVRYHGQEQ